MNYHMLSGTFVEIAKTTFSGQAALTPAEVALVLFAIGDADGAQKAREGLRSGHLLPRLKKSGGRWLIPIASVVSCLEALGKPLALKGQHSSNLVFESQEAWGKVWEKYDALQMIEDFRKRQIHQEQLKRDILPASKAITSIKEERF